MNCGAKSFDFYFFLMYNKKRGDSRMYKRRFYLDQILKYKDTEFIKVITGVRRSGKTYLLNSFKTELLTAGIEEKNIFSISFESYAKREYRKSEKLYDLILEQMPSDERVYFIFDEIQMLENWQDVINSLRIDFDSDIYVTGSNAAILSGELATLLSGRYVQIEVLPLSFKEYLEFKESDLSIEERFFEYLEEGGFPAPLKMQDHHTKSMVMSDLFNTILYKDIAMRAKLTNEEVLVRVVDYLLDNIGNTISANKISNVMKNEKINVSTHTVDKILSYLESAYLFYRAARYDIRGKERLKTLGKYFVVDTGLRNNRLTKTYHDNMGSQIENVVYLELKRRGYQIFVGKYDDYEIDFIAYKKDDIKYYQVTRQMPEGTREEDNLLRIPTNYEKTIITGNRMDVGNIAGIKIQYITDFLLE